MAARSTETELLSVINPPRVLSFVLQDDGTIPNSRLPLLIYQNAIKLPVIDPAAIFERLFATHRWNGSWRNGIYPYHHYHSTAHEVLAVFNGFATVQLGGERGITHKLYPADVVVIPAGVAHRNLRASNDLGVVGAYPAGQTWDMNYGTPEERPQADKNIARVPKPENDPVYGVAGLVMELWAV